MENTTNHTNIHPMPEEKLAYAELVEKGVKIGLFILTISFFLYVSGLLEPKIPLSELNQYIGLSSKEYLKAVGLEQGWSWTRLVMKGDFLNLIGIAFLSLATIGAYIVILPIFFRKKNMPYAIMTVAEIAILILAASGLIATGH